MCKILKIPGEKQIKYVRSLEAFQGKIQVFPGDHMIRKGKSLNLMKSYNLVEKLVKISLIRIQKV